MTIHLTRYYGPTNRRPSRIVATDSDNNRVSASLSSLDDANFDAASKVMAYRLRDKMGWKGELIGGGFEHDMYWVFVS